MGMWEPSLFHQYDKARLFGYLIVVTPSADIVDYVNNLKSEFYQRYGSYESRRSKPHITITHFPLLEERQNKVFSSLQDGLYEIDPFVLKLQGFDCFQTSNVIYLDVEQSEELERLQTFFLQRKVDLRLGKKCTVVGNYHLTIAKKLDGAIFKSACAGYLSRSYHNAFPVEKLTVLRYDLDKGYYSKLMDLKLGSSYSD